MGRNEYGHTHFKSSFVTATRMLPGGARGRDHCGCATATVPGRYLWWYNGHPPTAKILTAHAKSWLEDTLRATKEKPAGIIPAEVQFETDKLFNKYQSKPLILDMFAALYGLTDDDEYLEPFRALLRDKIAIGGPKWALTHSLNYVQYRILTGDTKYDEQLRSMAAERYDAIRADDFHQRGIEVVEGQTLFPWIVDHRNDDLLEILRFVIRNNRRSFFAYCPSDPPTDRVYPWGRAILPVVMLGGRLFDGRAADPLPSAAFLWEGIDTDVVSMVFERAPSELKMLVYNFKAEPVKAGLRAVQLPEGRYRLATALDKDGDRKPDAAPDAREVRFRRFTPTPLTIPSRQPLWVELKLLKKPQPRLRTGLQRARPLDVRRSRTRRRHRARLARSDELRPQLHRRPSHRPERRRPVYVASGSRSTAGDRGDQRGQQRLPAVTRRAPASGERKGETMTPAFAGGNTGA
jgi:hypothetical protein